jgi:signal transduction histidine kinase
MASLDVRESQAWLLHEQNDRLEAQARLLDEQNSRVEAANALLVAHEARIVHQNEELSRRRHEAEEASGRKTRLLNAVSHDIRNPANTINLIAEVIRRSAEDPALVTNAAKVADPGAFQRLVPRLCADLQNRPPRKLNTCVECFPGRA